MRYYFADTWFFVALIDRRDSHHSRAIRLSALISPEQLVIHDGVFTEMLATFAEDGPWTRRHAVDSVRQAMRRSVVIPSDRELLTAALDRYAARPDKDYSLTDCMSMVVMEQHNIRHVLTNDHHFAQAGFIVVSE